jgi:hypothetical protein
MYWHRICKTDRDTDSAGIDRLWYPGNLSQSEYFSENDLEVRGCVVYLPLVFVSALV